MDRKPRVVFPFVEAGFGHIMTMKAVADKFEQKYGDRVEVIRSKFFKENGVIQMVNFEKLMSNEVVLYNSYPLYGHFSYSMMNFFGTRLTASFLLRFLFPRLYKASVSHFEELQPDLVVSTHWATNYYANKMENVPLTVTYCPDVIINKLFRYKCDLTMTSMEMGYNDAMLNKKRYNEENLKLVPFLIRNEVFELENADKRELRIKNGFDPDCFTIVFAEGGYGIGKMLKICKKLLKTNMKINVIAIAGKNEKVYAALKKLTPSENINYYPFGFCNNILEIIASADLFCGKSGNMIAEPCFFGVPEIISQFSTQIERDIACHYIEYVGSAIKEFNVDKAVSLIQDFYNNPKLLEPYQEAANNNRKNFGAEVAADEIFKLLQTRFPSLK